MTAAFQRRFTSAQKFETELIDRFMSIGWLAAPFGQAQIPEEMRRHLARYVDHTGSPALVRWMPDIIAVRPAQRPAVCLVDAKSEQSDTPNYAVEINAVDAGITIARDWHMPLYYVWPDGGVLTPHLVLNRHNRRMDGSGSAGSGTAFYLVAKSFAWKFGDRFPPYTASANAA